MDFGLSESQLAWRDEVREFLDENMTDEVFEAYGQGWGDEGGSEAVREFRRRIAKRGWYGVNWPREYGGLQKSAVEQLIMLDEFDYVGAPHPEVAVRSLAPMIIRYGTEENCRQWLPKITSGETRFALGYSEPDAGSDLASLTTRAELDGDEWVVNGAKIWNSGAHHATHEWLAVRTSQEERKHAGISILIMPLDLPGIEVRPIHTWAGLQTNSLFLTDVRVPKENLIGEAGRGWSYITGALAFERGSGGIGQHRRTLDDLLEVCRRDVGGRRLIDEPSVRRKLAELEVDITLARLLAYQTVSLMDQGVVPAVEGAKEKVASAELRIKLADFATQILGAQALLTAEDEAAPAHGLFEERYRQCPLFYFVGGANDILRDMIAQVGHGMPRTPRVPERRANG
jgi:alkylation response protein AidB-like acyl-CoA dehydrogenase